MIKIERTEVVGLEASIREMHYAIAPFEKSDGGFGCGNNGEYFCDNCSSAFHCTSLDTTYNIGPNDFALIRQLRAYDAEYRKFLRSITVYVDITAPLYWWTGFNIPTDGMTINLYEIMSKIEDKEFTLNDFSCEHLLKPKDVHLPNDSCCTWNWEGCGVIAPIDILEETINMLNQARKMFLETNDDKYWWQIIRLLPNSYNKKKMVTLNYEILMDLYESHQTNKFDEWSTFCNWVEVLPYSELIIIKEN